MGFSCVFRTLLSIYDEWLNLKNINTAWKVSKYGVSSVPYFPVFWPEKTPYLETFHAVESLYWPKVILRPIYTPYVSMVLKKAVMKGLRLKIKHFRDKNTKFKGL